MPKIEVEEVTNKKNWEKFLLSKDPGTFLQSWNWGETNRIVGFNVKRLGFYRSGKLIGIAQLIHQPAKRGQHYLIPGGPVINYYDQKLVEYVFRAIRDVAKNDKVWFVRVRPDVKDSEDIRKIFSSLGLVYAPFHLHGEHTLVLEIGRKEDEILRNMRKTTRYLIRKSLNEGFKIRISKDFRDVKILSRLQEETVRRHGFVGFSKELFESELKVFSSDNQAELFICEKNGEPYVSSLVIYYGRKAFYYHSASSDVSQGTNASYFTQWQIIKRAKELGYQFYDFWGIAPSDDPKHRFAGVTIFKKGFGGERVDWIHAHDLPINPLYWLTYVFETFRRKFRHL